jgi:hypothetical protein
MTNSCSKYIFISYENRTKILNELHSIGIKGYEYALSMTWEEWHNHYKLTTITLYVDFSLRCLFDAITIGHKDIGHYNLEDLKKDYKSFCGKENENSKNRIKGEIISLQEKIKKLENRLLFMQ